MKQLMCIATLCVVLSFFQSCGSAGGTGGTANINAKDPSSWPEETSGVLGFKAESPLYKADATFRNWVFGKVSIPNGDITKLSATVYVEINSVYERTIRLTKDLKTTAYLDAENHPIAKATIFDVKLIEGNRYSAKVELDLKGKTQELATTFEMTKSGATPHVKGEILIMRQDFNVGTDKMKSIKNEVIVYYDTDLK